MSKLPTLNYQNTTSNDPKITSNIFAEALEEVFQDHKNDEFDTEFEHT